MEKENTKFTGIATILLIDENGIEKDRRVVKNRIVDTGLAHITSRLVGTAQAVMGYMAIGTGATSPVAGNTALGAESMRSVATPSIVLGNVANDSVSYSATFGPAGSAYAVTEAGIFNDNSAGTMLNRLTFAVINKGTLDTLVLTWKITASN